MANVAVLVGDRFEDSELAVPVERMVEAGHTVRLIGTEAEQKLVGVKGRVRVTTDAAVRDHRPEEFDLLLIPGGKSPAVLREDATVLEFVQTFCRMGRPVAAICHGPQLLMAAGEAQGRRMTGAPDVQKELDEYGSEAVDEELVRDGAFITSRGPQDLDAFCAAILDRLRERPEVMDQGVRTGGGGG
jgi:protease I